MVNGTGPERQLKSGQVRGFSDKRRSREKPPLDEKRLKDLALHYLSRYATSRHKLLRYLIRKLGERGWAGERPADVEALLDHMEQLGYLDDESYAAMRGASLSRRGYGKMRIVNDLRHNGIDSDTIDKLTEDDGADEATGAGEQWGALSSEAPLDHVTAALKLAERRRIGPFAIKEPDEKDRQKHIGILVRAGHSFSLAKYIVDQPAGADLADIMAEAPPE